MSVERGLHGQSERFELTSETPFNVTYSELMEIESSVGELWGATPLNAYARISIEGADKGDEINVPAMQALIASTLIERASTPPEWQQVPEDLRQVVITSYGSRQLNRTMANLNNFARRNHDYVPTPTEQRMIDRGVIGVASPAELAYIRHILDIPSVELASLTHPYGKEIEHLNDMRRAVAETVYLLGGEFAEGDDALPEYQIRFHDSAMKSHESEPLRPPATCERFEDGSKLIHDYNETKRRSMLRVQDGVIMTRKRKIGELIDGTVISERTSFILRIDEASGFDQEVAARMRDVEFDNGPEAKQKLWEVGNLSEIVPTLLYSNNMQGTIPLSSTIYASNNESFERAKQRDELAKRYEEQKYRRSVILGESAIYNTSAN